MDDLLAIARRQIDNYLDLQFNEELPQAFNEARRSSNSVSFASSSRFVLVLDKICADFISQRGAAVWEILHRCITNGRVAYSPQLAGLLKEFSTPYLQGNVGGLTERAQSETSKDMDLRASESARKRALNVLEAEIDLFCAVLLRAPQETLYQPPHVIHITGSTVTNLQTGHQSVAIVTAVSTTHQTDAIAAAIADLKLVLASAKIDGPSLFLVQEAEAELKKPVPEKSRLKSLMETMSNCTAGFINNAPKVPDAIEAVKRVIDLMPT